MIWAKRRVGWMHYASYQHQIAQLHAAHPNERDFMMVACKVGLGYEVDVYIGVPSIAFLGSFAHFEPLKSEGELPTEIDALLYANHSSREIEKWFRFRNRRAGRAPS